MARFGEQLFPEAVHRKIAVHLLPVLALLYVLAYLDRINVGFAQLQMRRDLGFTDSVYGFGAGIFFIGYLLCEIPSNLLLDRYGARRWIARIMVSWGLVSAGMALISSSESFYAMRFLLGVAEAGFFPGIIYYLGNWFPLQQRARAVSMFMTATAMAGILGGPVSGALLEFDGFVGLRGWQWLFIIESVPTIVAGFLVWRYLPDGPGQASWLTNTEKSLVDDYLSKDSKGKTIPDMHSWTFALMEPRCWLLSIIYFTIVLGFYTLSLWLPQIVQTLFAKGNALTGSISAIPYLVAGIAMVPIGISSDCRGEQRWHTFTCSFAAACGLTMSVWYQSPTGVLSGLCLAAAGIWGALGPFWALPAQFLRGPGLAAGIALINSIGNLGGFVGPYLVGYAKTHWSSLEPALLFEALCLLTGGLLVLFMPRPNYR